MTRKQILTKEAKRITSRLVENYQPLKVIIFGSLASGDVRETSDLDIAIVKKTGERFLDRMKTVTFMVSPKVAVDFLIYTPQEYTQMKRQGNYFIKEIEKGRIVYERK